jgi:hypothetical protein
MQRFWFLASALTLAISAGSASAQGNSPQPMAPPNAGMPMQQHMGMQPMAGMHEHEGMGTPVMHGAGPSGGTPTESGQAAFGAIQEIVRMLLKDPMTKWSNVNIDALRQHLIDMDELTLHADAKKEPIQNGLRILVTGSGRTLGAIQRMVPMHAQDINGLHGWAVQAKAVPDGEELTVTGNSAADTQKIRALGFMGVMVLGTHQMHHLAIAKGEMMRMQ